MSTDTVERAKYLLRSRNVWRWSIVNIARRQSVAEHSYLVWVIGMALYDECCAGHNSIDRQDFGNYLLVHDADEASLGDIPSTVKEEIERQAPGALDRVRMALGAGLCIGYRGHWLGHLYKMADLTEALLFVTENMGPGSVGVWLENKINEVHDEAERLYPHHCAWSDARRICWDFVEALDKEYST